MYRRPGPARWSSLRRRRPAGLLLRRVDRLDRPAAALPFARLPDERPLGSPRQYRHERRPPPVRGLDVRIVVVPAVLMISTHCRILTHIRAIAGKPCRIVVASPRGATVNGVNCACLARAPPPQNPEHEAIERLQKYTHTIDVTITNTSPAQFARRRPRHSLQLAADFLTRRVLSVRGTRSRSTRGIGAPQRRKGTFAGTSLEFNARANQRSS